MHRSLRLSDGLPTLTVDSPGNAWLAGPTLTHQKVTSTCITHWNGRRWTAFLKPYVVCSLLVSDRHRGVWLDSDLRWTGSELIQYVPLGGPGGSLLGYRVAPVPGARYQWIYGAIPLGRRHGAYQTTGSLTSAASSIPSGAAPQRQTYRCFLRQPSLTHLPKVVRCPNAYSCVVWHIPASPVGDHRRPDCVTLLSGQAAVTVPESQLQRANVSRHGRSPEPVDLKARQRS